MGGLTQIERLRLHVENDLGEPCLDSLLYEIETLEAQVRAADALAEALESSGNVTERHCRAMNALVAYRATKEGGA